MALTAGVVVAAVGLSVDLGRMFIVKNETQVFCDAAALAAALALDGSTDGIARAQTAVSNSANQWDFGTTPVSNPAVAFATSSTGPWVASPNPATGYRYARVTATAPLRLYFLPVVVAEGVHDVTSSATAAQVDIPVLHRGMSPYTVVSTNTTGPNFGLVVGQSYDLQWPQYNTDRHNCNQAHPQLCFVSHPCADEPKESMWAVAQNWSASLNGYWGGTSNSEIAAATLDLIQLEPVAIGTNLFPLLSNGNKDSEKIALDDRASQDTNTVESTVPRYLASSDHNGRRLIPVLIVNPVDPATTTVIGYGQFLLFANGSPSDYYKKTVTGNEPFCGLYVGPYNIGSLGGGAGDATGASQVKLVQ